MVFINTLAQSRANTKAASREVVVAAAGKVLVRGGSANFSLRAVARQLRCAPGSIYTYFENKEELIIATIEASFDRLSAQIEAGDTKGKIADRIRRLAEIYVKFGLANPDDYTIAFNTPVPKGSARAHRPHETFLYVQRIVEQAVTDGELVGSPTEIVQVIWMHLHGLVSLLVQRPYFPWANRQRLITALVNSTVRSLPLRSRPKSPALDI